MNDTSRELTWIIDPIDGTANYSRGIAQCAISVALKHAADIVLGVVYLPRTGELFTARRGCGAWLNGRRITVSARPFANAVMCTALPVYHKEHTGLCSAIIRDVFMQCNDIRRFGAAAPELCYLAMGRCELYFEYMLSPWDFAAASLIVTEAGGMLAGLRRAAAHMHTAERSHRSQQQRESAEVAGGCQKESSELFLVQSSEYRVLRYD